MGLGPDHGLSAWSWAGKVHSSTLDVPVVSIPHSVSQILMFWTHGSLRLFSPLLPWAGPKR